MSENSNNSSNNEKLNHMSSFNRDSIPRVRSFNSVNFPSPAGSNQYYTATPPQQSNGQGVAFTARPPVPRHQQPSQYVPFPYYYQQQQQQEIFYPPHMQMAPLPQQQPPSAQEFSDTLDPFIVDVLKKQQERIFLLKLEKELTAFINNYQWVQWFGLYFSLQPTHMHIDCTDWIFLKWIHISVWWCTRLRRILSYHIFLTRCASRSTYARTRTQQCKLAWQWWEEKCSQENSRIDR